MLAEICVSGARAPRVSLTAQGMLGHEAQAGRVGSACVLVGKRGVGANDGCSWPEGAEWGLPLCCKRGGAGGRGRWCTLACVRVAHMQQHQLPDGRFVARGHAAVSRTEHDMAVQCGIDVDGHSTAGPPACCCHVSDDCNALPTSPAAGPGHQDMCLLCHPVFPCVGS